MRTKHPALVLIDLQVGIFAGIGGHAQAEADARLENLCARLGAFAAEWIQNGLPLILVQHHGRPGHRLAPSGEGWALRPEIGELPARVVAKADCDAFHHTRLGRVLDELDAPGIVVGGCMTEFCVDTTCRAGVARGFDVTLIADGHETVDGVLSSSQVIAHHNRLLDGFEAGGHRVSVVPMSDLSSLYG